MKNFALYSLVIIFIVSSCIPDLNQIETTVTPSPTITHTATIAPSPAPSATFFPERNEIRFNDLGILWQECELPLSQDHTDEECLGVARTNWNDVSTKPFSESFTPPDGMLPGNRLLIGNDVYEAIHQPYGKSYSDLEGKFEYGLYKNGELLLMLKTDFGAYDPNVTLINVNGKYAWEFAKPSQPTIFFDGVDVTQELDLDEAYRPFVISENLIFIAEKDENMYAVFDGEQIGPAFDFIQNGDYCCEPPKGLIERRPGQYWFWGRRGDQSYVVVITEIK
jgi:hypothetical protein